MNTFFATFVPMSIAMFIVWFGTGIWHGASWKYVMYGLYYWAIMVIGLLMEPLFKKLYEKMNVDRQERYTDCFRLSGYSFCECGNAHVQG